MKTKGIWFGMGLALWLGVAGCLERKERITVREDLSASIECEFRGDASEFDVEGGDALPAAGSGWAVSDELDDAAKADSKVTRTARREVKAGGPLPETFAADAVSAEVSLRFPTSLIKEERADGTYYHFRRLYQHRDNGRYTWARRSVEQDSKKRELLWADPETLTTEDREELLKHVRQMETEKQTQYVEAGIAALKNRPQDVGLRILQALVRASESFDIETVKTLLLQPASDARDEAINGIAKQFEQSLWDAVEGAMRAEKLTAEEIKAFRAASDQERHSRGVTEDLMDEMWEVTAVMPGEIVGHNATRAEGGEAVWEFDGPAIMGRDQVLMVTSRVAKKNK